MFAAAGPGPCASWTMRADEALAIAARLLLSAEATDDLHRMRRLEGLADSWVSVASLMKSHDWEEINTTLEGDDP